MAIVLDHTIVPAKDKVASAKFFAEIFGLTVKPGQGHFAQVLRYQYGVSDFLTVLDAERTLLQAQDQLAQSETTTATALVAVYKALGGGWQ